MLAGRPVLVAFLVLSVGLPGCTDQLEPPRTSATELHTATPGQQAPADTVRLGPRERGSYRRLAGRYDPVGDLVREARTRLHRAQEQIEALEVGPKVAEGLESLLESFEKELAEAARTHSEAARNAGIVAEAAASDSKTAATEESYQALHDALTESVFIILGITSYLDSNMGACRAGERATGLCDPRVQSILDPLVDLLERAEATL